MIKRIAIGVALLGLVSASPAFAADEKTETRTEHEANKHGSSMTSERSSSVGGAKADDKAQVKQTRRSDGSLVTKKQEKHARKPAGKLTSRKSSVNEKTVRDANGNVVEHDKSVK